jgi:SagB-type dehydrogenase family enzyme
VSKRLRTVRVADRIRGDGGVPLDDPAEHYHEASKLYPSFAARMTRSRVLARDVELQASSVRAVRRRPHLRSVRLPAPELPATPFAEVVERRRSERAYGPQSISLAELAGVLHAAYGRTHQFFPDEPPGMGPQFRAVPSGGALYPLEVYVVPWRVEGLGTGLYHFDPLRRVLEIVRRGDLAPEIRAASIYPEPATECAVLLLIAAVFWRTRFKYGLRGYRFALLEAGHAAHGALLASGAYGLAAVPIGGFLDARMDSILGLDGAEESSLYAVALGRPADDAS